MSEAPAHITFEDAMRLGRLALELGYRACERGESLDSAMREFLHGSPVDVTVTITIKEPGT